MVWRFVPLAGTALFLAIAFCWRPWLQFRRYGTWGMVLFRSAGFRDVGVIVVFGLLIGQAALAAVSPDFAPGSNPFWQGLGLVLLLGGLTLLVKAQLDLGAAWRIGIDEGARPGLITNGLYSWCRNPIYVALLVLMSGYALLLPTRLSLALVLGAAIGIRLQVSAEEEYLLRSYGDEYRSYARRVGRFVPGLGLLR